MADITKIKLPNGSTYNIKDTTSGYTTNIGTVTQVKVGTTAYDPSSSGVVGLPAYPTATDSNPTLAWGTKSKVATVCGTDINVTMPANPNTDTKVTSAANHYAPATVSGQDKTASASGATAAWSIDVVKGVTLNTDGKGHVTGLSVTSGKIPANPNTDTKVTSAANHYTPATATGSDISASATGGTAAWGIDVVQGVTLNTDSKGHVTGLSVTSGKIPANPNTDTKVRQTLSTTNKNYPLLLSYAESSTTTANIDNVSYRANTIYANPSTGNIQATQLNGVTIGTSPKFTDQYVSQSATTTSDYRKIVLSYQNGAAGSAVTSETNVVYVTSNAEIQPSTGSIRTAGNITASGGDLTLYREGTTANNYPARVLFSLKDTTTGKTYTSAYLAAYQDHQSTPYGVNFVLNGGGGLFIGSGESPSAHYSAKGSTYAGEDTFITADGVINLQSNGNTIANRVGFQLTTAGALVPEKADTATTNIGSIGTSSYYVANGYFTNINGVAVGSSPKFTDTDTKVTSAANHYAPATVSGQDKTASASGATAAWSIDVVKGVTLNTDGKGHVTGISVTSGKIPANPNTDTKVTAVGNHYAPAEDSSAQLDVDASSTTAATWNSTSLVTGITVKRDAKGHVTGIGVDSIKMPANPNTNTTYTIGTSGNTITLTPSSGSAQSITAPYATSAGSVAEANLTWGGKNFAAGYGCIDAAMVSELGANRFMFAKAAGLTIEYTRDGGSTWTDYGATAAQKLSLFSDGATAFVIGKADSTNKATANAAKYQLRVTIDTGNAGIYTALNKFVIFLSTNGSASTTVTIQKALQSTPDTYTDVATNIGVSGWSGYNVINVTAFTTYGNTAASQYGRVRFIFKANGGNTSYIGMQIYKIMGFGGVGWTTPSTMAKTGHLYSFDSSQNATFPANVTATKFIGALQGNADTATSATNASNLIENTRMEYNWNGVNYFNISGTAGAAVKVNDTPTTAWWHIMRFNHGNASGYYTDLAIPFNDTSLYYKRIKAGALQNNGWVKIYDALNLTSGTAASGGTAVSLCTTGEKYTWNNKQNALTRPVTGAATWTAADTIVVTNAASGNAIKQSAYTIAKSVPSNAVFTDRYHKTGSWNGLTYTATAVNSADALAFTIPTGTTATTVAAGNHGHSLTESVNGTTAQGTVTSITFTDTNGDITPSITFGTSVATIKFIFKSSTSPTVTLTKTSGTWTAGSVWCSKWGAVVSIEIQVKGTGAQVAAGTDGFVGKISGVALPKTDLTLIGYTGSTTLLGWLDTSGKVTIRASALTQVASGGSLYVTGTYICA